MERDDAAGRRDGGDAAAWLAAFSVLLAAALVLHVLWWHGVVVRSAWLVVVVAALATAARPASVPRLALLLASAAVAIVLELPALGSHLLLVLGIAVCVLVHVAVVALSRRRLPEAAALVPALAWFVRASVVVLYAAAVLSKLNDDYLDAAVSPVAALTAKVLWFAPDALDGAAWRVEPAIWSSLLIELSLPVLLVLRRTRTLGLVVGLAFHGVLALSGTVPFTALMLALYVAFLPAEVVRAVAGIAPRRGRTGGSGVVGATGSGRSGRAGDQPDVVAPGRRADLVAAAGVLAWIAVGTVGTVDPGRVAGGVLASATRLLVAGASFALLAAVVADARGRRSPRRSGVGALAPEVDRESREDGRSRGPGAAAGDRGIARPIRAIYAAGVVGLVLVAAGPYVGLRTGDAFTMYSALDTNPGGWNHLFVPRAVRILD